ncbi:MAG: helix-hairpin-helix domain-containing protein [Burkholderiales bacterium]|nr:helix-hairpin-helix domain-containing protein [Burkholderiales bacterium]
MDSTRRFSGDERRLLLNTNGIGPVVVRRLEQAGYGSIEQLRRAGADRVASAVCEQVGNASWANRRRAIVRAIETVETIDRKPHRG